MVAQLLDKNPDNRPDALTLLKIERIWREAIRIHSKVAEVDKMMGDQILV
jgi:hypothetical protein